MPEDTTWVPEGGGKEEEFTALPAGFWNVQVEEIQAGYGKNSGEPYITWIYVVTDEEAEGSKLFHRTSMKEQAKSFPGDGFYAVLKRLDLEGEVAGKAMGFEELVGLLQEIAPGREAVASVSVYQYEGQMRNEIDEFWKPGEGAPPHQTFEIPGATAEQGAEGAAPQESAPAHRPPRSVTGERGVSTGGKPQGVQAEPPY